MTQHLTPKPEPRTLTPNLTLIPNPEPRTLTPNPDP